MNMRLYAPIKGSYEQQVINYLLDHKGEPQDIAAISFNLNISESTVRYIIQSIQQEYGLCLKNEKVYIPKENWCCYGVVIGIFALLTLTVIAVIQTY